MRVPFAVAAILALIGAVYSWRPRGDASPLQEVDTSTTAYLRGDARYAVAVHPGQYTVTATPVTCSPIGPSGVYILDFGPAACVVNLSEADHVRNLPAFGRKPMRSIYVASKTLGDVSADKTFHAPNATAVIWESGVRRLHVASGFLRRVYRLGDDWTNRRSLEVPFHSCYIGEGDMHSNGFVGCAALVLYDGQTTVFAHCLGGNGGQDAITVPGSITVRNVLDRLRAEIAFPGRWRAYAATGTAADLVYLSDSLRQIGIPLVHAEMMGKAGHGVSFCTRTATLSVVPQTP